MQDLLFVYGSLMRAIPHPMSDWLSRRSDYLGQGAIAGYLINLGSYPGLVLEHSETRVRGDIYRMRDPKNMIPVLDRYEGLDAEKETLEYARKLVAADLVEPSEKIHCWTYIFTGDAGRFPTIPFPYYPDFFEHAPAHQAFARHE